MFCTSSLLLWHSNLAQVLEDLSTDTRQHEEVDATLPLEYQHHSGFLRRESTFVELPGSSYDQQVSGEHGSPQHQRSLTALEEDGTFPQRDPQEGTIKSISLLGERNSGTRWIYAHLGTCFNHTIPVHRSLSRYKHWFQYDDASRIPKHTLAIAMFRDPITWTWAMKAVPHHAPEHLDLDWYDFVTREWTMDRLYKDEAWREHKRKLGDTGRICQENFHFHEVVSCLTRPFPDGFWGDHRKHRFSSHQPFYEMRHGDDQGRPYANILEMRADKIRNFMDVSSYANVEGFWHYRYEALLASGTEELVRKIERATGVKRHPNKCKIFDPQNRRKRSVDPEFVQHMIDDADWQAEALIGYHIPA